MALSHPSPSLVPLGDRLTVTVPLTGALSKNSQHAVGRGRVFLTADAQMVREALAWELGRVLHGRVMRPRHKVWLSLFVQRAHLKSDPINVLDAVADVVKALIGVDDRWFAVDQLDWALVRAAPPWVRLTIWQDAEDTGI